MRPSTNAVVGGLPRSWQTAPSMTVNCRGRSRSSIRRRASSMTSSVCTQTSPSGCHSGSCGQPTSAFSSGKSRSITPSSSASAKPADGRSARSSSFSISPQMRSAGRSSSGMRRQISFVPGSISQVESRGELDAAEHAEAVVAEGPRIDGAQHPALEQIAPAVERVEVGVGQRIPGDRVDGEVPAPRGVLGRHVRIAAHFERAMPAADLRFPARQRHVDVEDLVDGEALADGVDRPEGVEQRPSVEVRAGRRLRRRHLFRAGRAADRGPSRPRPGRVRRARGRACAIAVAVSMLIVRVLSRRIRAQARRRGACRTCASARR